ncbi:MAG: hypothetical protein ACXWRA_07765 [Pseudobdellovibrionaceae bacterium]
MAPPYLFDVKNDRYLAQMPAILIHLAKEYDYLPKRTETADLALKTILDCHDILTEIANNGGQLMCNQKTWKDFRSERLPRWMKIFERTGWRRRFPEGPFPPIHRSSGDHNQRSAMGPL